MFKNRLYRFLLVGGLIFLVWFLLYHVWIDQKALDAPIIHVQTRVSEWVLNAIGQHAHAYNVEGRFSSVIYLGSSGVRIGGECGGLELLVLFAGFILAFGGPARNMAWFIPLGIILIIALNVVRISSLTMMTAYYPAYVDFNHKYTFVIIVYAAIFGMWVLWTKKYSGLASRRSDEKYHA
jgi:exosortase family protein XrtF